MSNDIEVVLQDKLAGYAEQGVTRVKLGLTDVDGVLRGKYVSLKKFAALMRSGGGFCDCVFGWDVDDALYELPPSQASASYTGWHTGFPDAQYRLIAASERWLADENTPFFLGEFVAGTDGVHPLCPRTRLSKLLDKLAQRGWQLKSGFEYEFFVFRETPASLREKHFQNLTPLTPGNFGYSVLRTSQESDLFTRLIDYSQSIDCDLEGLHCETGPGVWEAALQAQMGMEGADRAALFKTFCKVFFYRQSLLATFMAKWSMNYPGQSGHFHFSLLDADGQNIFFNHQTADSSVNHMSALQRWAVAGLLKYLPEFLVMLAPTINSYTRLVKGAWAPTAATWGVENRTAAVRVIPAGAKGQRIECRVGGADGNPYLVAAAVVAAALAGIDEQLECEEPIAGNAYELQEDLPVSAHFPSSLEQAATRFASSAQARASFGDKFVDHFSMTRQWEVAEYQKNINDWQLGRYFEII